jgi:FG-GAP-like repeat/Secretion system C-terminal sorting domain
MKFLFFCGSVFFVCVTDAFAQSGFCFTPTTVLTAGTAPRTLVSADFNSDGNLDLAAANHGANNVYVYFGTGTGAFGSPALYIVGTNTSISNPRLTKGDFNNDGKMDIATANEMGSSLEMSVLLNNGNGTFAAALNYTAGNNPGFNMPQCIISNDFNNDNNADLALINMNGIALSVFLGNGSGSFPPCVNYSLAMMPLVMISDNFNSDPYDDLAISGNSVAILFGTASGTFSPAMYYPNNGFFLTSSDLNGDGFKDIATTTGVLLGSNTGTFSAAGNYSVTNGWGIACADYDGDGKKDVALNTNTSVVVLMGLGTGYFGYSASFTVNSSPGEMISADLNNDFKPDLAMGSGNFTNNLSILLNRSFTITAGASSTLGCPGLVSNLSVSGGASSYTWSTASNATAITVTTAASSVYTVIGTNSLGCAASVSIPINIHPTPSLVVSNSNTLMCSGATAATLQASGAANYTWNTGSTNASLAINPLVSTSYTIAGTNSLGCLGSQIVNVMVNLLPVLTLSSDTLELCYGSTATVSASGAATYSWSTGATVSNITVNPLVNTHYSVTGSSTLGCKTSNTVFAWVHALPTLTLSADSLELCFGSTATVGVSGAANYSWSSGTLGSTLTLAPAINTHYSVTGSSSFGCSSTATVFALVNPLPGLTLSTMSGTICSGESSTLTVSGALSYTWSSGQNGTSVVNTPSTTTQYTVYGTDANSCENSASFTQYVSECTELNEHDVQPEPIAVYPNPGSGLFYLRINDGFYKGDVCVLNTLHQRVYTKGITDREVEIDLEDFSNGVYFICLTTEGRQEKVIKVIKQ